MSTEYRPTATVVARRLTTVMLALLALSIVTSAIFHTTGHDVARGFIPLFNVINRDSVPTTFVVVMLVISAALLRALWLGERRQNAAGSGRWLVLLFAALLLATDKVTVFHRFLVPILGPLVPGLFIYGWGIPGAVIAVVLWAYLLPLFRSLAPAERTAMQRALLVYVLGAVVLAAVDLYVSAVTGPQSITRSVTGTLRAACEMSGIILFVRALILRADGRLGGIVLRFGEG